MGTIETHEHRRFITSLAAIVLVGLALFGASCSRPATVSPPAPTIPLKVYGWAGYMPESILTKFQQTHNIPIEYITYDSQEQAVEQLAAGAVYDVVVMSNDLTPSLLAEGLLAEINPGHVTNINNLAPGFRDLAYDPGNRYSVMIKWGTTGLVVRTDLVEQPVTSWNELWNPTYAGEIAVWPLQRDLIGIALKSLGYSYNSEEPAQLEQAFERLLALKQNVILLEPQMDTVAPLLLSGEVRYAVGWSYDVQTARQQNEAIAYVLPEEGTIIWGDNLTIPAASANKTAAEQFINFVLQPEISAEMVNELYVATPNLAANKFIDPMILGDQTIYPPSETMQTAEIALPLTPEGQQRYNEIWQRFLDGIVIRLA